MDTSLAHPSNCLIAGPSGSGKTKLVSKLLLNAENVFSPPPEAITYCYGIYQPEYDRLQILSKLPISFHNGFTKEVYETVPDNSIVVIDDLAHEGKTDLLTDAFVKGSHHRNLTLILVVHNIFQKNLRTISLNTHYYFLFKNVRDVTQIRILGTQLGIGGRTMADIYKEATSQPYGYLFIDCRANTPDVLRFRSDIFKSPITVFVVR